MQLTSDTENTRKKLLNMMSIVMRFGTMHEKIFTTLTPMRVPGKKK